MELLKAASQALQRHAANVALYIGGNVLLSMAYIAVQVVLTQQNPDFDTAPTTAERLIDVIALLVATVGWALLQSVVFSRIGRELDRPLWKVADDREAIRRFFPLWFEFNLVLNTLMWLGRTIATYESIKDAAALPLLFSLGALVVLVPFGASIMFHGRFSWNTLGESLAPLGRRLPQLAIVFALTAFQVVIMLFLDRQLPETFDGEFVQTVIYKVAIISALSWIDCMVFTATWLVCKDDRDSPDEFDLDF